MKFGLTSSEYEYISETLVRPLSIRNAIIWCYGSRARGDFKPFSDLDLMIEANSDVSSEVASIREKIESSNFPYKVDIVLLEQFASSYRPSFEKDKVRF